MNQSLRTNAVFVLIVWAVCVLTSAFWMVPESSAAEKSIAKQVASQLKKIKSYDFGDSREKLTQLSDLINQAYGKPDDLKEIENECNKFLQSKATFASKQFVCQQLSIFGTEASVPALSQMLVDTKYSDMARYALERIPGPSVNQALLSALPKVEGKTKVGVINTLGQKGAEEAVSALVSLVEDADVAVAEAAVAALGKIGGAAACEAVAGAVNGAYESVRLTALDAYIECANRSLSEGDAAKASAIFKGLDGPDVPSSIRAAALRGVFKSDAANAHIYLNRVIQYGDPDVKDVAMMLLRELPDKKNLPLIAKGMPNLCPRHKVQLLTALADIGEPSVIDVVLEAVNDDEEDVRVAALKALAYLGDDSVVLLLAERAALKAGAESETAGESLSLLKGETINKTMVAAIDDAEPKVKVALIEGLGERNATETMDILLASARDSASSVRRASIEALEDVAAPEHLPDLVDILIDSKTAAETNAAISMVTEVSHKIADSTKQAEAVLNKLPDVTEEKARVSLLRVLGRIGDDNALPVLREALKDDAEEMQIAAIRALSDWPTTTPVEDLLPIAKTSQNPRHQVLALRGYVRLVKLDDKLSDDEKAVVFKNAMGMAKEANEKRLILSGLGELSSLNSLNTALTYLEDQSLQAEAEVAVVQISGRIRGDHPKEAKKALTKVLEITQTESTREDAKRALERIK